MEPEPETTTGTVPPTEPETRGKTEACPEKPVSVAETDCRRGTPIRTLLFRLVTFGPLKYVYKMLQKMMALVGFSIPVEDVGSVDQDRTSSPTARRVISGRKRIGKVARFLLSVAPQRLQSALGYPMSKGLGDGVASEEVRQSPTKPCGKGSKRKVEDLDMEEQHSWIEFLAEDLPEDAEEGDVTYQCSKSETDSEEYQSKNDTESDIELEERDGQLMLKENNSEVDEALALEEIDVQWQSTCLKGASPGEAVVNGGAAVDKDVVNGEVSGGPEQTDDQEHGNGGQGQMANGDRGQQCSSTE